MSIINIIQKSPGITAQIAVNSAPAASPLSQEDLPPTPPLAQVNNTATSAKRFSPSPAEQRLAELQKALEKNDNGDGIDKDYTNYLKAELNAISAGLPAGQITRFLQDIYLAHKTFLQKDIELKLGAAKDFLQVGNIAQAEEKFADARKIAEDNPTYIIKTDLDNQIHDARESILLPRYQAELDNIELALTENPPSTNDARTAMEHARKFGEDLGLSEEKVSADILKARQRADGKRLEKILGG